jgi:hypothetical protein
VQRYCPHYPQANSDNQAHRPILQQSQSWLFFDLADEKGSGKIPKGSTIVCTLTGHGLKDPDTAITQCKDTMININPVMEEVKNAILDNM